MKYKEFKKGQKIRWKEEIGEVNFIDKMYITITLRRWKKSPELAEHSCYPYGEVNLLCKNKYWDEFITVMNRKGMTNKLWYNHRPSRPCFYN